MSEALKEAVHFYPTEFRATGKILDVVGQYVEGAGPKTDALNLIWRQAALDEHGGATLMLDGYEFLGFLGAAKIADGLNNLIQAFTPPGSGMDPRYQHGLVPAAEAVVQLLEEHREREFEKRKKGYEKQEKNK